MIKLQYISPLFKTVESTPPIYFCSLCPNNLIYVHSLIGKILNHNSKQPIPHVSRNIITGWIKKRIFRFPIYPKMYFVHVSSIHHQFKGMHFCKAYYRMIKGFPAILSWLPGKLIKSLWNHKIVYKSTTNWDYYLIFGKIQNIVCSFEWIKIHDDKLMWASTRREIQKIQERGLHWCGV
jgi:hypothetical protein